PKILFASWLSCLSLALVTLVMALLAHSPSQQALLESLRALLRLVSIASASLAFMSLVPSTQLTGLVAWLISPLERAGVRTAGFVVAFHTALSLAPAFVRAANCRWTKGETRVKLRELYELLPELIDEVLRDVR
ncbi:MAG: hypothetical protein Q4B54_12450, partial [Coriobacteriales bacterium]|nr:hypothetical protein [Coriobacteriales bacterium]